MGNVVMDLNEIKKVLPHRYPFLFIDKVIEINEGPGGKGRIGRSVRAIKNVTCNEPFFQGHFPNRPVMPGALLIDAMAQSCALGAVLPSDPRMNVAIVVINNARFRKPVVPGDTLEFRSKVIKDRGNMLLFESKSYVDDVLVAEAEIMANVWPMENQPGD